MLTLLTELAEVLQAGVWLVQPTNPKDAYVAAQGRFRAHHCHIITT